MEGVILTPLKNTSYIFPGIGLISVSDPSQFLTNPTFSAGDFKISKDGGAFVNLSTLPTLSPAGGDTVVITLSAEEMNADKIVINAQDQGLTQWISFKIGMDIPEANDQSILTSLANQAIILTVEQAVLVIEQNILDLLEGDYVETNLTRVINKRGTTTALLSKTIVGSLLLDGVVIKTLDA